MANKDKRKFRLEHPEMFMILCALGMYFAMTLIVVFA